VPVNGAIVAFSATIVCATTLGFAMDTTPVERGFFFTVKRLEYFWIFFMTLNIIDTEAQAKTCIRLLLFVTGCIALYGIAQFVLFPGAYFGGITGTVGTGRANTFGSFLLIMTGLVLGMFTFASSKRERMAYGMMFLLFLMTLVATKSRGAYVSVPPLILAVVWLTRNRRTIMLLLWGCVLSLMFMLGVMLISPDKSTHWGKQIYDIKKQFQDIGQVLVKGASADSSLNARLTSWKATQPEMVTFPILGQGVGAKPLGTSDNQYVREVLETGFVGLLCLLYLNFVIMLTGVRLFRRTNDPLIKGMSAGFVGGQVGLLFHGVTISNFYTILTMELFFFLTALLMLFYYQSFYARQPVQEEATA